jgi:Tfp pilus assembly protein PilN
MKEIDFLPKWYKSGKRRQISYRTQYAGLAGIFVVMMVWNFAVSHSISKATAALAEAESKALVAESTSEEFAKLKSKVAQLQKQEKATEEIESKIDVTSVLAEISFLIDKKIVLSKVDFIAEKLTDKQVRKLNSGSAVKATGGNFLGKETLPLGYAKFKVMISGVAADASDVAKFICRLEDSPYFRLVYPSFSRNRKIKAGTNQHGEGYQATEFEISCYLANYEEIIIDN